MLYKKRDLLYSRGNKKHIYFRSLDDRYYPLEVVSSNPLEASRIEELFVSVLACDVVGSSDHTQAFAVLYNNQIKKKL